MKRFKKMETVEAVAYFTFLMVRIMRTATEATKKHFLEMAQSLSEETDQEVKVEKIKILLDILKEKNMMGNGNFSVYYYELGDGSLSGAMSWKGWYHKAPKREVTVSFKGDEAILEFCTGTGKYSTFLELPDEQCQMSKEN